MACFTRETMPAREISSEADVCTTTQRLAEWAKSNKVKLTVAGIGIVVGVASLAMLAKLEKVSEVRRLLPQSSVPSSTSVKKTASTALADMHNAKPPHNVRAHVRNLPAGQSASAVKTADAAANGFCLKPGQTWVVSYGTGTRAA